MFDQLLVRFMACSPQRYRRKSDGSSVLAIKSIGPWGFEDHRIGDFIIFDETKHLGQQLYRCPPKRFSLIFEAQ